MNATPIVTSQEVLVSGLSVAADIGVFAHEMGIRQKLVIDVVATIAPPQDDLLTETLDYGQVVHYALELAEQRHNLIETFARKLAQMCLQQAVVQAVEVRIEKPSALPQALAGTRIRMHRS